MSITSMICNSIPSYTPTLDAAYATGTASVGGSYNGLQPLPTIASQDDNTKEPSNLIGRSCHTRALVSVERYDFRYVTCIVCISCDLCVVDLFVEEDENAVLFIEYR
jgi:hypothetical protein